MYYMHCYLIYVIIISIVIIMFQLCIHTYIYDYSNTHIYIYIYVYTIMFRSNYYRYMYMYIYIYIYIYIYVHIYIHMRVCIYIYIYIYICTVSRWLSMNLSFCKQCTYLICTFQEIIIHSRKYTSLNFGFPGIYHSFQGNVHLLCYTLSVIRCNPILGYLGSKHKQQQKHKEHN